VQCSAVQCACAVQYNPRLLTMHLSSMQRSTTQRTAVSWAFELDLDLEKGEQINTFPSYKTTTSCMWSAIEELWSCIQYVLSKKRTCLNLSSRPKSLLTGPSLQTLLIIWLNTHAFHWEMSVTNVTHRKGLYGPFLSDFYFFNQEKKIGNNFRPKDISRMGVEPKDVLGNIIF